MESLLALGIGIGCGLCLFGQVYVLRRWNRTLPLRLRPVNYILGDGTLLVAFALWGWLTGHLEVVSIYALILSVAGAFVVLAYAALERQEGEGTQAVQHDLPARAADSEAADARQT